LSDAAFPKLEAPLPLSTGRSVVTPERRLLVIKLVEAAGIEPALNAEKPGIMRVSRILPINRDTRKPARNDATGRAQAEVLRALVAEAEAEESVLDLGAEGAK